MKLHVMGLLIFLPLCMSTAFAQDSNPAWITQEKLAAIRNLGIDTTKDLQDKGNYHWRFVAKKSLSVGQMNCPIGTTVDISRSIMLITAPPSSFCSDDHGASFASLKLLEDGTIVPIN